MASKAFQRQQKRLYGLREPMRRKPTYYHGTRPVRHVSNDKMMTDLIGYAALTVILLCALLAGAGGVR